MDLETPEESARRYIGVCRRGPACEDQSHLGLRGTREVSRNGTKDLAMGMETITGYSIITAESLEEAEKIAAENPFIASIQVSEIMEH